MSTTVTGSPPRGQVASHRGGAGGRAAPRARRRFRLPQASTSNAAAGSDAFAGLDAGIVVLALVMAVGCGWGLTRRLAEYR
jgi:hypothetical protein